MKTKKEILESHHDSALGKLLEEQINLIALEKRTKEVKPGTEFDKIQEAINAKKENVKRIELVLGIIEDMIKEEGGK